MRKLLSSSPRGWMAHVLGRPYHMISACATTGRCIPAAFPRRFVVSASTTQLTPHRAENYEPCMKVHNHSSLMKPPSQMMDEIRDISLLAQSPYPRLVSDVAPQYLTLCTHIQTHSHTHQRTPTHIITHQSNAKHIHTHQHTSSHTNKYQHT